MQVIKPIYKLTGRVEPRKPWHRDGVVYYSGPPMWCVRPEIYREATTWLVIGSVVYEYRKTLLWRYGSDCEVLWV